MARAKQTYDESSIQVFAGLEGIRRKPTMYIGDMNEATWTTVREVADNCVDEFLAGRNDSCLIVYDAEGYVWVADKGNGIPVGQITIDEGGKKIKTSALTALLSRTHAGGKFHDGAYQTSSGTHGVGAKVVNAISSQYTVWTCRDGEWYTTEFEKGVETTPVEVVRRPPTVPLANYKAKLGTIIRFKLDWSLFPRGAKYNPEDAHRWAQMCAYLNPGMKIMVATPEGRKTYLEPDGLWSMVERDYSQVAEGSASEIENHPQIYWSIEPDTDDKDKIWCDFAFVMAPDVIGTHMRFYTNGVTNPDGGVHETAFWGAVYKALCAHAPARAKFSLTDIKEGVVGVLNLKINSPQFNNQTKEKLVDSRVKNILDTKLYDALWEFFKKNRVWTREIIGRAVEIGNFREQAASQRKVLATMKKKMKTGKPSKFASVSGKVPADKVEIYIVEGDSAGGSARQARNRDFQAVLPLKGKPLNSMKSRDEAVLLNEEVMNICNSMGYIPDGSGVVPNTFGKIILLSDPDVDGYHINALVLTVFQKYMPELFEQGKVFALDSRNCKNFGRGRKGDYYFGRKPEDVERAAIEANDKIVGGVSYLKGWGELDPAGLKIAAMNPATRGLIKLTGLTPAQNGLFCRLMGEDVAYRRKLLGV